MDFQPRTWFFLSLCLYFLFQSSILSGVEGTSVAEQQIVEIQRKIDFQKDIKPILESRCIECHGRGKGKGGFHIDTREQILQGSDNGPVVVTGESEESYLVRVIERKETDTPMPPKGTPLSPQQIGLIRAWIDQGLQWETGFSFAVFPEAPLLLRRPVLPGSTDEEPNPIDRILEAYYQRHGFEPPQIVSDRVFARRVYFDVVGLPPSEKELEDFLSDRSPQKRENLVDRLLGDNRGYAENWITFWNDLLRNDFTGTGYIDGGRKQITQWLYHALETNLPYNRFVKELVFPVPGSEGFIKGIVWRGVTNSSQTPEMQAAQNIGQVFLGINLKCASCHDSFISNWKLEDSYALATVFSATPLEIHRCDAPTGKIVEPRFLYPQLGEIDPTADRRARQEKLAEILVSPENGRLARTIVNRIWARVMGRGLIEPNDDMDRPAWNPDLLDWLAFDFVEHGYDLKYVLRQILISKAYQLPSVPWDGKNLERFVFHGPVIRRLTAEQFRDAFCSVTHTWIGKPAAAVTSEYEVGRSGPRSWLLKRDSLMVAMGRPNRDQINSQRNSFATTLEALELTNGQNLSDLIAAGAENLIRQYGGSTENLVLHVFRGGLGRDPTEQEQRLVMQELEASPTQENVEDFLWGLVMLPEFQLIY